MNTPRDESTAAILQGISQAASETLNDERKKHAEMIRRLAKAREDFFTSGKIDACVRPEIASSWKHCRKIRLDPTMPDPRILQGKELSAVLERNEYLIRIANPVIRKLQEKLTEAGCLSMAYITDESGVILDVSMPDMFNFRDIESGFGIGALWNEDSIGTNAVGLALRYDRDFATYAPEHYMDDHTFINCATSPIHTSGRKLAGTITVSYAADFYNDLINIPVGLAAQSIERLLINRHDSAVIDFTTNELEDGVLILNADYRILQINRKMKKLLRDSHVEAESLDIRSLFRSVRMDEIPWGKKVQVDLGETFLSYRKTYLRVRLDAYRIDNGGTTDGYVIICKDMNDLLTLSQQVAGSQTRFHFDSIITQSSQMKKIIDQCRYIADQNMPVLIEGESGTGKEVLAQSIHSASRRSGKPFIAVNCAALPINLVESELFGYEKGTFTDGLSTGKAGKFEMADGGTIFLDEIGELPLDVQAKLLRVLDSYKITRIGGKYEKSLDIRVIAATNRDLRTLVENKSFREDLYYRINVMTIILPPLSERKGDIPLLARHFVGQLNLENSGPDKKLAEETIGLLERHVWKGNVRELQNAVTRAYYLCDTALITPDFLPHEVITETIDLQSRSSTSASGRIQTWKENERDLIARALQQNDGNISKAARSLDISRATMYRKIREYRLGENT